MEQLPPIPIPAGKRWREFRLRVIPGVMFLGVAGVVAWIWVQQVNAPTLRAEAEAIRSNIASPQAGVLTQVLVKRFQKVAQGEALAVLVPNDPRVPLALLQAEIDILRARLEPRMTAQRNATDYERLRLDWMLQKVRLATTRVKLARAENELQRREQIFQEKVISEASYDDALKERDELRMDVQESEQVVAGIAESLDRLSDLGNAKSSESTIGETVAVLAAHEQKLRLAEASLGPITLTAPIDGMVSAVFRHGGENVQDGEPIIELSAFDSNRVVGYLRQPLTVEPVVGMSVEVRTRALQPVAQMARITEVGNGFEPVTESLSMPRPGGALDVGLPIAVSLPSNFRLRPGEIVDLVIRGETP